MVTGPILTAVGTRLLTRMNPNTATVELSSYLVLVGLGMGLCMQQPYTAVTLVLG